MAVPYTEARLQCRKDAPFYSSTWNIVYQLGSFVGEHCFLDFLLSVFSNTFSTNALHLFLSKQDTLLWELLQPIDFKILVHSGSDHVLYKHM